MKIYWKGHGCVKHGNYYLIWGRNPRRESMLYQVRSSITGRTLLCIEVF